MSPATPPLVPTTQPSEYSSLIERAAFTENFDVQKLQALLDMRESEEMRRAEKAFNASLVRAQSEMSPVVADANNPQTRSRYATYAALDRAIRPHYTAHGLAPSFGTEPLTEAGMMRVVGILGHIEGFARRYQIDMPIDTKGARGGDVMTRTHATGSALTYGKRYLLIAMFNLSIADDSDDDGNAAGGRRPYRPAGPPPGPRSMDETVDRDTGEVIEHCRPFKLELAEGGQFTTAMINQLQRRVMLSKTIDEFNEWRLLNQDMLLRLRENKPELYRLFEKNIEAVHERLLGTPS
ncbi:ERF family protein [Bradyrhizobium septentrionale]|uniref:ERF family protein n=1 Tax=Bradyrhizobium septentrionale TaxID=1404411 RepID=UPI0030CA5EAB